jgi:hypothetical protein
VSDLLYYTPAMQAAAKAGLQTALTRGALYDMWINRGDDALVTKANTALGGPSRSTARSKRRSADRLAATSTAATRAT